MSVTDNSVTDNSVTDNSVTGSVRRWSDVADDHDVGNSRHSRPGGSAPDESISAYPGRGPAHCPPDGACAACVTGMVSTTSVP
jgi:hypothetical protein